MAKVDSKGRIVLPQEVRERLVDEAASERGETTRPDDSHPVARKHRDAVRRGAQSDSDE